MVTYVKWDDSLLTGIPEVDHQHKRLIEILNELYAAMHQGRSSEILDKILEELVSYTHYHFRTEEQLMEQHKYAEMAFHKLQHERFIAKVNEFLDKKSKGQVGLGLEIANFLKEWLLNHIKGTDKKLSTLKSG